MNMFIFHKFLSCQLTAILQYQETYILSLLTQLNNMSLLYHQKLAIKLSWLFTSQVHVSSRAGHTVLKQTLKLYHQTELSVIRERTTELSSSHPCTNHSPSRNTPNVYYMYLKIKIPILYHRFQLTVQPSVLTHQKCQCLYWSASPVFKHSEKNSTT